MSDLELKMNEYEKTFGESFPSFNFTDRSPEDIVKIIDRCMDEEKDVYELGYISEDPDIKY